jgi:hypothetical protein
MLDNIEINGYYYQACDGCIELLCKIAALEAKVEKFTSTNISVMPCPHHLDGHECFLIALDYCTPKQCTIQLARA